MAVKLRLSRHGRKSRPFYYILVADSRSPRDGRFIERIGSYNPVTNPATIELDCDKALDWLMKGAQPTDTVRRILSYKGVLLRKHLLKGVKKGAFDEAEADRRFVAWQKEKEAKVFAKISGLKEQRISEAKVRLEAETKVKEQKAEVIAKKLADIAAAEAKAKAEAEAENGAAANDATPADTAQPADTEAKAEE